MNLLLLLNRLIKYKIGTDEETAQLLCRLLCEAETWGRSNGLPVWEKYPQYDDIRQIGSRLHVRGGLPAMQRIYYMVRTIDVKSAVSLGHIWHGVETWLD